MLGGEERVWLSIRSEFDVVFLSKVSWTLEHFWELLSDDFLCESLIK